jgi:hypothetical protein
MPLTCDRSAPAEERVSRSRKNHDSHVFIVSHLMKQLFQLQDDFFIEWVALLWAIKRERCDPPLFFKNEMVWHSGLLSHRRA